jgi:hypothetical protein
VHNVTLPVSGMRLLKTAVLAVNNSWPVPELCNRSVYSLTLRSTSHTQQHQE